MLFLLSKNLFFLLPELWNYVNVRVAIFGKGAGGINDFLDVLLQSAEFWSLGILIGVCATAIMSLFFKKYKILVVAFFIVIMGIVFMLDSLKYTTFEELVSEQLNEETTIRNITITINELSGNIPEKAKTTIENQDIIKLILEDFSGMELKKDLDAPDEFREFHISILTTNPAKENGLVTNYLILDFDKNYLNNYEIVNKTDHLKTIEYLIDNDEVEWEFLNE